MLLPRLVLALLLLLQSAAEGRPAISRGTGGGNCSSWRSIVNEFGTQVFLLGDRGLRVPADLRQLDTITCPRLRIASERIKDVLKACLRPFPKTVAGLMVRGARRQIRIRCGDLRDRQAIVHHLSCLRQPGRLGRLHDLMDLYNRKLVYLRDNVTAERMLDLTCCHYFKLRSELIAAATGFGCNAEAVRYLTTLLDEMLRDAIDVACSAFQQDPDGGKCAPVLRRTPLPVTSASRKETDAFLLPLIEVLTSVGDN